MELPPCPACGAVFSADVLLVNRDAKTFMAALAKTPSDVSAGNIILYFGLFRPPTGSLSWSRAVTLIKELLVYISSQQIATPGKPDRPSTAKIWGQAIDQILAQKDKVERPLTNHNYLRTIAWGLADKEDAERERNSVRHPSRTSSTTADVDFLAQLSPPNAILSQPGLSPIATLLTQITHWRVNGHIDEDTFKHLHTTLDQIVTLAKTHGAAPLSTSPDHQAWFWPLADQTRCI